MIEDEIATGYALEPHEFETLRTIAECLLAPGYLTSHARRDLGGMLMRALHRATPLLDDETGPLTND